MAKRWLNSADVEVTDVGALLVATCGKVVKRAAINAAAAGDNEIVAAVTGKSICVLAMLLMAGDAVTATAYSDNQSGGTPLSGAMPLAANGGFVLPAPADPSACWFKTAVGKKLNLYLSAAKQVSGAVVYYEE
jgi:hypothetical protein